jgi:uncharacterized membrane protein YecN with MAPEG domain
VGEGGRERESSGAGERCFFGTKLYVSLFLYVNETRMIRFCVSYVHMCMSVSVYTGERGIPMLCMCVRTWSNAAGMYV